MSAVPARERLAWLATGHGIEPGFHDIRDAATRPPTPGCASTT